MKGQAMKLAIILATLALSAPFAHAGEPKSGFVDTARVYATATAPVRLFGELAADKQTKDNEVSSAVDAFNKAKPAEREALRRKAVDLDKMDGADLKKHDEETRATVRKALTDALARLRVSRHLAQIHAGPGLVESPGIDLTDDVIKLMDAADAQGLAMENAKLKAERAALTKPAPPSVPPPPPTQPLAAKGKK
jgi:Skp family chaperone for outer membrane proteins